MHVDMKKQKTTLNACNYVIEKNFFDFGVCPQHSKRDNYSRVLERRFLFFTMTHRNAEEWIDRQF